MTTLDDLLHAIDPRNNLDVRSAEADEALNTFTGKLAMIERWDGFRFYMARLYGHVLNTIYHIQYSMGFEHNWAMCVRILSKIYGKSGFQAAFEIARTGKEGGLRRIVIEVAKQIAEDQANNEIRILVDAFVNRLHGHEQDRIAFEYIQKYSRLLPSELIEDGAVRVRANLTKILERHPHMVQQLRRIGR